MTGIDIGGTNIIIIDNRIKRFKTPKTKKQLISLIRNNTKGKLGIGVAGIVENGKVLNSPNIPYLNNLDLKKELNAVVDNDVNCFTLAEARLGAGKRKHIVFGLTLGTGVGGALVINNKVYRSSAGEIGHHIINFNGYKCICGNRGCFEEYCSKRFFKRKHVSSEKASQPVFNEYAKYLGIGLANIINIIDPDIIVIGGGITKAHKHFLFKAKQEARKRVLNPNNRTEIKLANLKESVAIGARLLK